MKKLIAYILAILATAGVTGTACYVHKDDITRILHLDNKEEIKQEINQGQDENQNQDQLPQKEKVAVLYNVNGEVTDITIADKDMEIVLLVLDNTETQVFKGWQIKGQEDLFTDKYHVTQNTEFVAVFVDKYNVQFMVDGEVVSQQYLADNENVVIPESPAKDGYTFVGWSIDGENIIEDAVGLTVIEDTTISAVFEKIPDDWNIVATGEISSLNTSKIWTDGTNYYYSNNAEQYIFDPVNETFTATTWTGLSSFSGDNIWTDGTDYYYSNKLSQYVLEKGTQNWSPMTWNGIDSFYGLNTWSDGTNYYYSFDGANYQIDIETKTFTSVTWNGLTDFRGCNVWTDGENIYFSKNANNYILDLETKTWNKISITGIAFEGANVWTDGVNYYVSSGTAQYVLDLDTMTMTPVTWTGLTQFGGSKVIAYGNKYFVSDNNGVLYLYTVTE